MALPTFGAVGSTLAVGVRTTSSVPVPASAVAGSGILVVLQIQDLVTVPTAPAGFTGCPDSPLVTPGAMRVYFFQKRATGADSGTYDFTHASINTTGLAIRLDGCATTGSLIDTTNGSGDDVPTASVTPAVSLFTTGADRLLVWIANNFDTTQSCSTVTGFTERADTGAIAVDTLGQAAEGWTGITTGTLTANVSCSAWFCGILPVGGLALPAISIRGTASAVTTASRSPAVTFDNSYTPLANDVVAFFAASTAAAAAATVPSGFVLPTPVSGANPVASDSHTAAFCYHLVTSGDESAVTRTYTATNLWDVAQTGNVLAIALRGVDASSVIDSLVSTFDSTNTVTPHVLPALTGTNLSHRSLVVKNVASDGVNTWTTPTAHTAQTSFNTNQGNALYTDNALTVDSVNVASVNITPNVGDEYCSFSVAFTNKLYQAPLTVLNKNTSVAVKRAGFY